MIEYYAPLSRIESENIEAIVWGLIKDRFADNTIKWGNINVQPVTGKTAVILPKDWRDLVLDKDAIEQKIKTQDEMEQSGWFPNLR